MWRILILSLWLDIAVFGSQLDVHNESGKLVQETIKNDESGEIVQETIEAPRNDMKKQEKRHYVFARSCADVKKHHPLATSRKYRIHPHGFSSSVSVHCDMVSKHGIGVTEIGHDSEARTHVNEYERPGSYVRTIKYDISMMKIEKLMKMFMRCEQFIKYECKRSVFHSGGTPYGWWVSRQGCKMNYWGDAAVNSGKCKYGRCNCDKNDGVWREDSGYLTDKNTLPVSELRFGDTGNFDEQGYHTLGKLRCWD